jgi:hypothetical protein
MLKPSEEGITDHDDEDGPEDGLQKRREDSIEEVEKKGSDRKGEDKEDMFFFHFSLSPLRTFRSLISLNHQAACLVACL